MDEGLKRIQVNAGILSPTIPDTLGVCALYTSVQHNMVRDKLIDPPRFLLSPINIRLPPIGNQGVNIDDTRYRCRGRGRPMD